MSISVSTVRPQEVFETDIVGNKDMMNIPFFNQPHDGIDVVKIRSMLKETPQIEMRICKIPKTLIPYVAA